MGSYCVVSLVRKPTRVKVSLQWLGFRRARWTVSRKSVSAERSPVFSSFSVVCLLFPGWRRSGVLTGSSRLVRRRVLVWWR